MRKVNWICWLVFVVVQQLLFMSSGEALIARENGISSISKDRIVEGTLAGSNQFPWAAAIYRNEFDYKEMKPAPNSHSFRCGGTIIIKPNFILTAAFCVFEFDERIGMTVYKYEPHDFRVVIGSSDIAGDSLKQLRVQNIFTHHEYNNKSQQSDLALLKLSEPLVFNNTTQPINLRKEPEFNGQIATVAGWGDTCLPNSTHSHLRFAVVKIMPFENCTKITETLNEESVLCVGPDLHVFKGDQGSGMWIEEKKEKSLIGIVSSASSCQAKEPSVFTNVPHFYKWIMDSVDT